MSPRRPATGNGGAAGGPPRENDPPAATGARDLAQLHRALRARHLALLDKYEQVVRRLGDLRAERSRVVTLAGWLMRSGASGLALFRHGELVMTNPRWHDFTSDAERPGGWDELSPAPAAERRRFPDVNAVAIAEAEALLAGEPSDWVRVRRYRRDTGTQFIELRLERTDTPSDEVVVALHDVTESARMQDDLDRARRALEDQERLRMVGEIAAGVAHDLNNTLNALALRLEMSRSDPGLVAAHAAAFEKMERIVADAVVTARRLQEVAGARRARSRGAVDLRQTLRHVVEMTWATVVEKSALTGTPIKVRLDAPELPPVIGVEEELRPMLMNLVLNARDAMPKGGTIEIAARRAGDRVSVTVSDEGQGIRADHLAHIFRPFFTTKGERGTGLGLSMASAIMEGLGGDIAAANRDGGGAVFTLTFPVAEVPAAEVVRPARSPLAAPPRPARVLVVDDDDDNREALIELLALIGHDPKGAAGGRTALQRLRAGEHFDVVLCDLGMPDMNGWAVAAGVGKVAPGTPVYLFTGWALEIAEDDPRRKLVRGILAKPLDVRQLEAVLPPATAPTV